MYDKKQIWGGGCKASKNNSFDNYTYVKKLGSGSFGQVTLVRNIADMDFAMKTIIANHDQIDSIDTEIAYMKLLDHPYIVKFYEDLPVETVPPDIKHHPDYDHIRNIRPIARQGRKITKALASMPTRQKYRLLLEYCQGGDLITYLQTDSYKHIHTGKYTKTDIIDIEDNVKTIMYQILQAVNYLHDRGIIHRDLKPENILLKFPNNINCLKIADFGLSIKYDSPYCCSDIVGTSIYMAPEVFTSNDNLYDLDHKYDHSCDLWSIGVILYQLLSGYHPFENVKSSVILDHYQKYGQSYIDSHFKYTLQPSKLWGFVSEDAKTLLQNLLEINPEHRWTAERCLTSGWFKGFSPDIHTDCYTSLSECSFDDEDDSV